MLTHITRVFWARVCDESWMMSVLNDLTNKTFTQHPHAVKCLEPHLCHHHWLEVQLSWRWFSAVSSAKSN